jgi:hypothetical protein
LSKVLLFWNVALTVIVVASLLVNANFVMASNDPPVKVFTATADHAGGLDGASTNFNSSINSDTTWTLLESVNVNFGTQTHPHHCVAVASADVINPYGGASGAHNSYRFDLSINTPSPAADTPGERMLDFVNTADSVASQTVTTNRTFFNIGQGSWNIYFLARRSAGGTVTATVSDVSMSVVCMKVQQ